MQRDGAEGGGERLVIHKQRISSDEKKERKEKEGEQNERERRRRGRRASLFSLWIQFGIWIENVIFTRKKKEKREKHAERRRTRETRISSLLPSSQLVASDRQMRVCVCVWMCVQIQTDTHAGRKDSREEGERKTKMKGEIRPSQEGKGRMLFFSLLPSSCRRLLVPGFGTQSLSFGTLTILCPNILYSSIQMGGTVPVKLSLNSPTVHESNHLICTTWNNSRNDKKKKNVTTDWKTGKKGRTDRCLRVLFLCLCVLIAFLFHKLDSEQTLHSNKRLPRSCVFTCDNFKVSPVSFHGSWKHPNRPPLESVSRSEFVHIRLLLISIMLLKSMRICEPDAPSDSQVQTFLSFPIHCNSLTLHSFPSWTD